MKNVLSLITLLEFFVLAAASQPVLDTYVARQDSLAIHTDSLRKHYSVTSKDTLINGMNLKLISEFSKYYYGKIEIKERKIVGNQPPATYTLDNCYPCYRYSYRNDGTLYDEGVFLTDCPYGPYIRYFHDGNISMTGNYIPGPKGKSGSCSLNHGESAYYNRKGEKLLSEFWNKGKLVNIVPYNLKSTGDVIFLLDNNPLRINDTCTLESIQNIKLSPDSNQNTQLKDGYDVVALIWQKQKQKTLHGLQNLKSLGDPAFSASLRELKFNWKEPMKIIIYINEANRNEIIESHCLFFEKRDEPPNKNCL